MPTIDYRSPIKRRAGLGHWWFFVALAIIVGGYGAYLVIMVLTTPP
jgi:hypothetical protein